MQTVQHQYRLIFGEGITYIAGQGCEIITRSFGEADICISICFANKKVDIPVATAEKLGVVKSSSAKDQIAVGADGIMSINTVSLSKIVQAADETLIINGGNSGLTIGE